MTQENEEIRQLIVTDPEHRDQASLVLLYAMNPSEEDLLAIILHVPFLRKNAYEKLLASTPVPSQETLWQIVGQVAALQEQAEDMLFKHYPSHANLAKLIHPTWGAWNAAPARLLLQDNPSSGDLRAILEQIPASWDDTSPWRELRQKAQQMLLV